MKGQCPGSCDARLSFPMGDRALQCDARRRVGASYRVGAMSVRLYNKHLPLEIPQMIETAVLWLLKVLAAPTVGLTSVFLIAFVSATLVPLGSEPAVFAVVKANPAMFWPAVIVASIGNTLGGAVDYFLGYRAKIAFAKERQSRWFGWLAKYGAKTMLLSWVPGIGDPLCTLAGWLHLPFWPSVMYMAIGKFARYLTMTAMLLYVPDDFWRRVGEMITQITG